MGWLKAFVTSVLVGVGIASQAQQESVIFFSDKVHINCTHQIHGIVTLHSRKGHSFYFRNLTELSGLLAENLGARVEIKNLDTDLQMTFPGQTKGKELKKYLKNLEPGKYDMKVTPMGENTTKITYEVTKDGPCRDSYKGKATGEIDPLIVRKSRVFRPHNPNFIAGGPVIYDRQIKGFHFQLNKSLWFSDKLAVGLAYRMYQGVTYGETDNLEGKPVNDWYIPESTRLETFFQIWPSSYSGIHIDLNLGKYKEGDMTYGFSFGMNKRIFDFFVIDLGAGLQNTTSFEPYDLPMYFRAYGKVGFNWSNAQERPLRQYFRQQRE